MLDEFRVAEARRVRTEHIVELFFVVADAIDRVETQGVTDVASPVWV